MRRHVHRLLESAVAIFNRNPWTGQQLVLLPRDLTYADDGLWTNHATPFLQDAAFCRAYARAVEAAGGVDDRLAWRAHVILWAARRAAALEGSFVECGAARGFLSSAICEFLDWKDRPFYLLDTFEPHPVRHYAVNAEETAKNFQEWPGVSLIVGRIPDTLTQVPTGPIAYLHIDMNHPDPEADAVRHFWPSLVAGGVLIFDDYGFPGFTPSQVSADRLAEELGFEILALPTGQGLVLKR